jgi:glycosyltransferase involved in cell wall biosynthesis
VTPSYQQVNFVEATLRSVLLQGYPRLQYLVLDGGSVDGAAQVIERYGPWMSWWVSERDGGQSSAINRGFSRATGDVVAWLNTDDRYLPGTLHAVARAFLSAPDAAAWVGASRQVNEKGRLLHPLPPRGLELPDLADWGIAGQFAQPASFYRRDATIHAGPLDERLQWAFDVDFFIRLARQGRFVAQPETWTEETFHRAAKTIAHPGRSSAELRLVQIRQGFEEVALSRLSDDLEALWSLRSRGLRRHALDELERLRLSLGIRLQGRAPR